MLDSMFHLPLPVIEKIVRPIIVYLCLVVLLRVFGKRELAQLNPFDLVVLLSLSNTVQNAIIGNDNSVSGGIIGACSLLTINWLLTRLLFKEPKLEEVLEGTKTEFIRDGIVDQAALKKEALTEMELLSVLHKQGLNDFSDVKVCALEPNGTFYVEAKTPTLDETHMASLMESVDALRHEMKELRAQLATRNALDAGSTG